MFCLYIFIYTILRYYAKENYHKPYHLVYRCTVVWKPGDSGMVGQHLAKWRIRFVFFIFGSRWNSAHLEIGNNTYIILWIKKCSALRCYHCNQLAETGNAPSRSRRSTPRKTMQIIYESLSLCLFDFLFQTPGPIWTRLGPLVLNQQIKERFLINWRTQYYLRLTIAIYQIRIFTTGPLRLFRL